jgi:hypothetical protein
MQNFEPLYIDWELNKLNYPFWKVWWGMKHQTRYFKNCKPITERTKYVLMDNCNFLVYIDYFQQFTRRRFNEHWHREHGKPFEIRIKTE